MQECLPETEIQINFPEKVLGSGNYILELENNSVKKRVGTYVRKDINYTRRADLEKPDHHVIIIDVFASILLIILDSRQSFEKEKFTQTLKRHYIT